jgi:poly(hydroxyalkanoate) depolymerase family esterase
MNAFSKIDMAEVTRLTRAGRLAEATALLQGRARSSAAPGDPEPKAIRLIARRSPTVDPAAAPQSRLNSGQSTARTADNSRQPGKPAALLGFAHKLKALRERLPRLGSFPDLGGGASLPRVPVPEGASFEERTFSNAAGTRSYKVYAPSGYRGQPVPVVVMLHGCTQGPDNFALGTRMNEVAEEQTFLVVYPLQPQSANMKKCWNWFNAADQRREGGEPSLIAGIALQTVEEFSADPARVYVAGLSAGGAAAAILARTHPDVFAAAGVHSGLACGAAADMPSAFAAMAGRGTLQSSETGPMVPTIVFHGDADRTVHVVNGEHVVAQARPEAALTEVVVRGQTPDGMTYTRTIQHDAAGRDVLEHWVLHGAGHAWSGGSVNGSYADTRGPDASREMIRFFLQHGNDRAPKTRD